VDAGAGRRNHSQSVSRTFGVPGHPWPSSRALRVHGPRRRAVGRVRHHLAERFEPELAVAGIEDPRAPGHTGIEQNYFKLHACCRFNHFALDAVMALRSAYRLSGKTSRK
jgi:hypothetical protein